MQLLVQRARDGHVGDDKLAFGDEEVNDVGVAWGLAEVVGELLEIFCASLSADVVVEVRGGYSSTAATSPSSNTARV